MKIIVEIKPCISRDKLKWLTEEIKDGGVVVVEA